MEERAAKAAERARKMLLEHGDKLTPRQQEALAHMIDYVKGDPDTPPQLWHCDVDCRHHMQRECAGNYGRTYGTAPRCPYYDDMLY
ncbi:MAG: hypothetical protein IJ465_06865 [Clostridia bacterium]|nr:hypothetical protein [Clostridia bacterium]